MNPTSPKHRTLIIWSLASTLAVFTLPATAQTVIGGDTIDAWPCWTSRPATRASSYRA